MARPAFVTRMAYVAKKIPSVDRGIRTVRALTGHYVEPEMGLLPFLVDPSKISIDVGANRGAYTHLLLRLGGRVIAIDPNSFCIDMLKKLYGGRATVLHCALSDAPGEVELRIPSSGPGEVDGVATIEAGNTLDGVPVVCQKVQKITLDSVTDDPVGFIKIDVEGHEAAVLRGARKIIENHHPIFQIEAENRHHPNAVAEVTEFLAGFGYHGFMLNCGRLQSIAHFDPAVDQKVPDDVAELNGGRYLGRYINNFLFVA
jgi:FkbM family methyltransferase